MSDNSFWRLKAGLVGLTLVEGLFSTALDLITLLLWPTLASLWAMVSVFLIWGVVGLYLLTFLDGWRNDSLEAVAGLSMKLCPQKEVSLATFLAFQFRRALVVLITDWFNRFRS